MLTSLQNRIDCFRFVLASGSPRRLKLLEELAGFSGKITTMPSKFEENLCLDNFANAAEFAIATSLEKAKEVAKREFESFSNQHIIISADTVIESENRVLGKPIDADDNFHVLKSLSGKSHSVHTGVTIGMFDSALLSPYNGRGCVENHLINDSNDLNTITFSVSTIVSFSELPEDVIKAYVNTGEGLDKAGGYGIQALGSTLVDSIQGDFHNVVGLPLTRLCQELYSLLKQ